MVRNIDAETDRTRPTERRECRAVSVVWRRSIQSVATAAVLLFFSITLANSEGMPQVNVNGTRVKIYGTQEQGFVVVAGDRVVLEDDTDAFLSIKGVYSGDGKTYVVISGNCGGSACGPMFHAVDLSDARFLASPKFGAGVIGAVPIVKGGALVISQESASGTKHYIYHFKDGQLKTEISDISLDFSGPATPPGGDLAAFADGKTMADIFKMRAFGIRLRELLGASSFADARSVALYKQGGPFSAYGDYVYSTACEPHNCGSHSISIAFDHEEHVWALLKQDDAEYFYANPPYQVMQLLRR
jgi:hypothetical protein